MSSVHEIRQAIDLFVGDTSHSDSEVQAGLAEVANYADRCAAVFDTAVQLPSPADDVEYQA